MASERPGFIKRLGGLLTGFALRVQAIEVPGATVGQVLKAVNSGGRVEFIPQAGGAGGIPPGTHFTTPVPFNLATPDLTVQGGDPWFDMGVMSVVPSALSVPGATTTASFTAMGQVTRGGGLLFGDVRLYDMTNAVTLAGMSLSDNFYNGGTGVVTLPGGPFIAVVQARLRVPSGALPGDVFNLRGAVLTISNTF